MRIPLLFLFILSGITLANAQSFSVSGTVSSAVYNETLPGASVELIRLPDSVKTAIGTDPEGNFKFQRVAPGNYTLRINFISHQPFYKQVLVQNSNVQVGELVLKESATTLKEIEIVGTVPLGTQKGDTIIFNAGAFKVAEDASAEDLVTKLPGVTIEDGKIQAQGEDVKQVLVDGKRFFGEDANTALRNLPAEVIENIEIFDKRSDQAEFSGFDDGNRSKTINIVTKQNKRHGQFGKVSAGIGPDGKYMAGASVNFFKGDRRFTVNGLTNNINMQDYSIGERPGGGMRGRRSRGAGSDDIGIATTNNFGLNYSEDWGDKIEVSGNYNYSNTKDENNRISFRDYYPIPEEKQGSRKYWDGQETRDTTALTSRTETHNLNFRFEYNINERNKLLIRPRLSMQKNANFSRSNGRSIYDKNPDPEVFEETILNNTNNLSNNDGLGYDLSNNIYFSHRFNKPGRTLSVGLTTDYSLNDGDISRITNIENFERNRNVYLNQQIETGRSSMLWRGNVGLGEKVGEKARVQLDYTLSNRYQDSERLAYDLEGDEYSSLNTRLSNSMDSEYMSQKANGSYLYNSDKLRVQLEAQYQVAELENEREFPSASYVHTTFHNFLPAAQVEYKFSKTKNLQLDYRTNTDAPSATQLQEVVDNTNPLRFSTGNPNLVQEYQNSFNLRYRSFNLETNKVFTFFITGSLTNNYITNSTTQVDLENEPQLAGFDPSPGARFIRPVNLDGNWSARTFVSYGQPLLFIKSNLNLNGSINYSNTPALVDNETSFQVSTNYRLGGSLTSNISENVDFNLSSHASYREVSTDIRGFQNTNSFFTNSTQLRTDIKFWESFVYRAELSHQYQLRTDDSDNSQEYNVNYTLLNMSLSKKIFKNQKGEISLSVNDLLNQNVSVNQNNSDIYDQYIQSTVLQRFYMLTFSYNIRSFGGASVGNHGNRERRNTRPSQNTPSSKTRKGGKN